MTDEQRLKRRIAAAQFASWELRLFLDTHPENKEAVAKEMEYAQRVKMLTREYEEKYGPISSASAEGNRWKWVNDPWPWETEGN